MKRTLIKMCGLTQIQDVREALALQVDLIGLNFHPASPRALSFQRAQLLANTVHNHKGDPKRPSRVAAVFVDPPEDLVHDVIAHVKPDVLQFHGDEPPEYCRHFKRPFIKAFRLQTPGDAEAIDRYMGGHAVAYLIDAYSPDQHGGTGQRVRLDLLESGLSRPRGFLAGGLTAKTVGPLVQKLRPYGVDVASGIETRPGLKNHLLMRRFVEAVHAARTPS